MDEEENNKPKMGRPLLFDSVEKLQEKIDAYFADCDPHPEQYVVYEYPQKTITKKLPNGEEKEIEVDDRSQKPTERMEWGVSAQKPYLITGLAVFLKTSRRTLINYEERDGDFFHTIKAAKDRIEAFWENQLLGAHATGPIFNLKNNYDWRDKTESEITNPDGSLSPYANLSEKELRKLADKDK